MALYGSNFTYDGKSSETYSVVMCTDGAIESVPMGLSRELIVGEMTAHRPTSNYYGVKYSEVLSFEITITKKENDPFTRQEVRDINKWLTGVKTPSVLSVVDEDTESEQVDYIGLFTGVDNAYASGIVMLTYNFQTNAPYAWSKVQTSTYTSESTLGTTIDCDSDEINEYIYPTITIEANAGTTITLTNKSDLSMDANSMKITFPQAASTVYIDSKYHKIYYINSSGEQQMLTLDEIGISTDDANKTGILSIYWFRLLSGENAINISGNCTLTFSYRVPRKVGAY